MGHRTYVIGAPRHGQSPKERWPGLGPGPGPMPHDAGPMSYGPVLCPMALSYLLWPCPILWPCPVSQGPALCPILQGLCEFVTAAP